MKEIDAWTYYAVAALEQEVQRDLRRAIPNRDFAGAAKMAAKYADAMLRERRERLDEAGELE